MLRNRRLETDEDFQEAMERGTGIRVFQDDYVIQSGGVITRFTDSFVVIQSDVSDLQYYDRSSCEFFEARRRS
ncbi:hypothetical protein J31TS4_26660 [Paenibacillus sp. J31TS4]|uniref:hypothetical protein n=1 Tax=Paenibacillus sp. J31TS4 TaxID=2807195 RepID=UPI001B079564|nr:hypothetical protein [Paenibacillus sp. J31TS4]GIP39386.1 hypothetical protein J31TS4_26660 [Paenibacillus sp. J31TS4]